MLLTVLFFIFSVLSLDLSDHYYVSPHPSPSSNCTKDNRCSFARAVSLYRRAVSEHGSNDEPKTFSFWFEGGSYNFSNSDTLDFPISPSVSVTFTGESATVVWIGASLTSSSLVAFSGSLTTPHSTFDITISQISFASFSRPIFVSMPTTSLSSFQIKDCPISHASPPKDSSLFNLSVSTLMITNLRISDSVFASEALRFVSLSTVHLDELSVQDVDYGVSSRPLLGFWIVDTTETNSTVVFDVANLVVHGVSVKGESAVLFIGDRDRSSNVVGVLDLTVASAMVFENEARLLEVLLISYSLSFELRDSVLTQNEYLQPSDFSLIDLKTTSVLSTLTSAISTSHLSFNTLVRAGVLSYSSAGEINVRHQNNSWISSSCSGFCVGLGAAIQASSGSVILLNERVDSNSASAGLGGHLWLSLGGQSNVVVTGGTFTNNTVGEQGSGSVIAMVDFDQLSFRVDGGAIFDENDASRGVVYVGSSEDGSSLSLECSNVRFESNVGGAIRIENSVARSVDVIIGTKSLFVKNRASDGAAVSFSEVQQKGGTALKRNLRIEGEDIVFDSNVALVGNGGAISLPCGNASGSFVVSGSVMFTSNDAMAGSGGALSLDSCNEVEVGGETIFDSNFASESGGGIALVSIRDRVSFGPRVQIRRCVTADSGGGLYMVAEEGASQHWADGIAIRSNHASRCGGGVLMVARNELDWFRNASVQNNIANTGGGIFFVSNYTDQSVLPRVRENRASLGIFSADFASSARSFEFNLLEPENPCRNATIDTATGLPQYQTSTRALFTCDVRTLLFNDGYDNPIEILPKKYPLLFTVELNSSSLIHFGTSSASQIVVTEGSGSKLSELSFQVFASYDMSKIREVNGIFRSKSDYVIGRRSDAERILFSFPAASSPFPYLIVVPAVVGSLSFIVCLLVCIGVCVGLHPVWRSAWRRWRYGEVKTVSSCRVNAETTEVKGPSLMYRKRRANERTPLLVDSNEAFPDLLVEEGRREEDEIVIVVDDEEGQSVQFSERGVEDTTLEPQFSEVSMKFLNLFRNAGKEKVDDL